MKIFKWFKRAIDNGAAFTMMGKTVIRFTTHGCQGQIQEFDFIGKIVGTTYPKNCNGKMFYKIEVLKSNKGEARDGVVEYKEVASWYLQNLGGDFFIVYD